MVAAEMAATNAPPFHGPGGARSLGTRAGLCRIMATSYRKSDITATGHFANGWMEVRLKLMIYAALLEIALYLRQAINIWYERFTRLRVEGSGPVGHQRDLYPRLRATALDERVFGNWRVGSGAAAVAGRQDSSWRLTSQGGFRSLSFGPHRSAGCVLLPQPRHQAQFAAFRCCGVASGVIRC